MGQNLKSSVDGRIKNQQNVSGKKRGADIQTVCAAGNHKPSVMTHTENRPKEPRDPVIVGANITGDVSFPAQSENNPAGNVSAVWDLSRLEVPCAVCSAIRHGGKTVNVPPSTQSAFTADFRAICYGAEMNGKTVKTKMEATKMKKEFIERIIREGTVDTRNYRYRVFEGEIIRLPIEYLGTTAAFGGWETVKKLYPV